MKYFWCLVLYLFGVHGFVMCQLRYDVAGFYNKQTAQGFAIYKNKAFLLNHSGWCRVFDLKTKELLSDFPLGSFDVNNHANCAFVWREIKVREEIPLLYISECTRPFRCFVEEITDSGSVLVQTISLKRNSYGIEGVAHNWAIDKKNEVLYSIGRLHYKKDTTQWTCIHRITKYRLPKLNEGKEVFLTDNDVLDYFDVFFPNLLQGATIRGKYLYLPTGRHQSQAHMKDAERALIVVNLNKHRIERKIDLSKITDNEPEDCEFYKGKLLMFCGQSGGLYVIPTK